MDVWQVWHRLGAVRSLRFEARPYSATGSGWCGTGTGEVVVGHPDPRTLTFHERGTWTPQGGIPMPFTNTFRWTAAPDGGALRLEHLRFGARSPVLLFDLVPIAMGTLRAAESHACGEDRYAVLLTLERGTIVLDWEVTGLRKDERIAYVYS